MPIRRAKYSAPQSSSLRDRSRASSTNLASVSTLPTVKAMGDCFERYLSLSIADGHASSDTIKTYRSRVKIFLAWCRERSLYPALVTQENIKEYRKHLIDGAKGHATIRLSLISAKHFYDACVSAKLVKSNPVLGVKPPRDKREVGDTLNYLSQEELQQLISSVLPERKIGSKQEEQIQVLRDRLLLGLMGLQGCRTIELYRANLGDISLKGDRYYLKLDGKNSVRTTILRPDIAREVMEYRQARIDSGEKLNASSALFISLSNRRYGQRLSRRGIGYIVDGYLVKCDLKHIDLDRIISAYSLRHTAGTLSLSSGASLREVQDFLGHADPKTTAIYTHVLGSDENNPASKIEIDF